MDFCVSEGKGDNMTVKRKTVIEGDASKEDDGHGDVFDEVPDGPPQSSNELRMSYCGVHSFEGWKIVQCGGSASYR